MGLTTRKLVESFERQVPLVCDIEDLASCRSLAPLFGKTKVSKSCVNLLAKIHPWCHVDGDDVVYDYTSFEGYHVRAQLNGSHGSYTMEDDHGPKKSPSSSSSSPKNQGKKSTSKHKNVKKNAKGPNKSQDLINKAIEASNLYRSSDGTKLPNSPCGKAVCGLECKHVGLRGEWCSKHRQAVRKGESGEVDPPGVGERPFVVNPGSGESRGPREPKIEETYEEFLRRCTMKDRVNATNLYKPTYLTRLMADLKSAGPQTIDFLASKLILLNVRKTCSTWGLVPDCECADTHCTFNCIPTLSLNVPDEHTFHELLKFTTECTYRSLTNLDLGWTKNAYDNMTVEIHDLSLHWLTSVSLQQLDGPEAINFLDLCQRRAWIGRSIGAPCCPRACSDEVCRYGSTLVSLRRRELEKPKSGPVVRRSDLKDKQLYLDVITSPALLGPSVVIAVLFSILMLWFELLGIISLAAICLSLLLCINVMSKTWYTVRPGPDMCPEDLAEIDRLSVEEEAGRSNQIGNQQERENFQKAELRRVIIEDHTFLTQMFARTDDTLVEIPAWLRMLEKRSYGFASLGLLFGLGFLFPFTLNILWFIASMVIITFERPLEQHKLICLNLFSSMTSHMAIRHGKSYEDYITCCDTLARTFSVVPLPTILSFMVPNCDSVPSMTRDVATLVFHHRKNVESSLPYLKAVAPRLSGPFLGLLVTVTGFFQPLWHSLVPLLQWVGLAALPLWNGFYLIQTVFPWPVTVSFLLVGALISLEHAIHILIPDLHMVLYLEQFIVFVDAFPIRILSRCDAYADSSDVSCAVILIRLAATCCISMIGFSRRIILSLRERFSSRCSNILPQANSGGYTTILDQRLVEDFLSRESCDDSALYLDISISSDDCLSETESDENNSQSIPLLKPSNTHALNSLEPSMGELNSPRSSLDLS